METGGERRRLEHDVAMAKRDLAVAEAAVQRATTGDRTPNESAFSGLEFARANLAAAERALVDYDNQNSDPK